MTIFKVREHSVHTLTYSPSKIKSFSTKLLFELFNENIIGSIVDSNRIEIEIEYQFIEIDKVVNRYITSLK